MPKKQAIDHERSSGNVFADLGSPNAADHLVKAGLVMWIGGIIRQRELSHDAAAGLLGLDEAKVSAMLGGRYRAYSVERLIGFLVALGHDVESVVKPRKRHRTAEVRVA